jgi:hypothetical protein
MASIKALPPSGLDASPPHDASRLHGLEALPQHGLDASPPHCLDASLPSPHCLDASPPLSRPAWETLGSMLEASVKEDGE